MASGGLWDTKHLVRQLPESFPRLPSTSLGPLYEALVEGGLALEVRAWEHATRVPDS